MTTTADSAPPTTRRLLPRPLPASFWQPLLAGLLVVAWLLLPLPLATPTPQARTLRVAAEQFAFAPAVLRVNRGDVVTIEFAANDTVHGLHVDGYGVALEAEPGRQAKATFTADREGRFVIRCSVTCGSLHPFMLGELLVEPNPALAKALVAAVALAVVGLLLPGGRAAGQPRRSGVDLSRLPAVRRLLHSRWLQWGLVTATLPFFWLAVLAGLLGTPVGNRNFATVFVWIVWWALLMLVLVPLGGRLWCAACPLPAAGEWLQRRALVGPGHAGRLYTLGWRWPRRLSNMWPQNLAFLAVALFSVPILTNPALTGWLLLLLVALAVACSLVCERRVFCRFLCPVGGFLGLYAQLAPLALRVRERAVCAAHQAKTCYSGGENGYGCPWLVYPGALDRNTHCGLCAECAKTCPLDNVGLYLRTPGADLALASGRRTDEAFKALIMLTSALAYTVVLTGPWGGLKQVAQAVGTGPWFAYALALLFANLVVVPGIFLACVAPSGRPAAAHAPLRVRFAASAAVLVPLGLAAWAAFSLGLALGNGSYALAVLSDPFGWGWNLFGTADWQWTPYAAAAIPFLQSLVLLAGLAAAVWVARSSAERAATGRLAAAPIVAFCSAFTLVLLALYLG